MLTTDAAEQVLRSLVVDRESVTFDVRQVDGVAKLRVTHVPSGREAVIKTPGDRWFAVDIDRGLSLDYFEEETPDSEARERLHDYFAAAMMYVEGGGVVDTSRSGLKSIRVEAGGKEWVFRRSVAQAIASVFRMRLPWSTRNV